MHPRCSDLADPHNNHHTHIIHSHHLMRMEQRMNNRLPHGCDGFELPGLDLSQLLSFDLGPALSLGSNATATDTSGQLAVPTFNANIPTTGASVYGYVSTHHSLHPWRDATMDAIDRSSTARVYRGWWTDPSEDEEADGSEKPKHPRRKRTRTQTYVTDKYARDGRADPALAFALVKRQVSTFDTVPQLGVRLGGGILPEDDTNGGGMRCVFLVHNPAASRESVGIQADPAQMQPRCSYQEPGSGLRQLGSWQIQANPLFGILVSSTSQSRSTDVGIDAWLRRVPSGSRGRLGSVAGSPGPAWTKRGNPEPGTSTYHKVRAHFLRDFFSLQSKMAPSFFMADRSLAYSS
ncbi:hypothetical protein BKA62DRAFT_794209 [Auriculariales sp. MPI-PUGE-AT-0066]|nr:hypothetical protein BKA62DRAFT_794209 [Auriculariales sp. MPI-PUGE-AT-0066]